MVKLFNFEPNINKERILKKLHIFEGTQVHNNACSIFEEVLQIIKENIKLTAVYAETDVINLGVTELDNCKKHVICFISSNDNISKISNDMMSYGMYLKGYLIHEIAEYSIFNASNELNKIVKINEEKSGYNITRRYAAGDGTISLDKQQIILDALKKEEDVDVYLNESNVLIPEMSLLYLFGLYKENVCEFSMMDEECSECSQCDNLKCIYRDVQ